MFFYFFNVFLFIHLLFIFRVEYADAGHRVMVEGGRYGSSGVEQILPGESGSYLCNCPDAYILEAGEEELRGTKIPIERASMKINLEYKTWLSWFVPRRSTTNFTLLKTSKGLRWHKGDWFK